jgi:hypothetical protein
MIHNADRNPEDDHSKSAGGSRISHSYLPDAVPPARTANRVFGCLVHPVSDFDMIIDRIGCFILNVVGMAQ